MIAHKHITKMIIAVMALAVCLCLVAAVFIDRFTAAASDKGLTMEYESALFDTSEIISINIVIDEDDWKEMLDNATAEEYYRCDVAVNGETFYGVGIRPKGNTSLATIAADPTTDRYSFKLEFDHYVDGQTCFGMDKLVLNNNYADATNMKEALIYDMYQYLGADASHIDLEVMGSMDIGGGFSFGGQDTNRNQAGPAASNEGGSPTLPESFGAPSGGFDVSQFQGGPPEDFDTLQFGEFDPSRFGGGTQKGGESTGEGSAPSLNGFSGTGGVSSTSITNLSQYGLSLAIMAIAFLFAVCYRRKPRRR